MKKIRYATAIIALILSNNLLHAQEFKVQVENAKSGKLILTDFPGDLPIEGYSGNEIVVTSTSDRFKETPDRAKGLKAVYPNGTDNTGVAVSMEKNGNEIKLRCLLTITQQGSYKIKVPENFAINVKSECGNSGPLTITNIKNEIDANTCQNITLKNVSGPLVLSNISGNISVVFSELSKDKPISIASISGEVDITLPAKASVDLEMSTISGNMYSDFDLQSEKKQMQKVGGGNVNAQLNGGGTDLKIHNVSGNIYLRKG
jgi:lia operon protein LiaG